MFPHYDVIALGPLLILFFFFLWSYYILQIIEEDNGSECYVFRKWGRVGNEQIGSQKLEEMSKADAIQEFKRLFLEKTGNPWEAWERKTNFQKQPGKFYPLDIVWCKKYLTLFLLIFWIWTDLLSTMQDYGVKQAPKRKDISEMKSSLAPQLLELMKMLFNVETYRCILASFQILCLPTFFCSFSCIKIGLFFQSCYDGIWN